MLLFTPVSITPLIDTEDALLVAHCVNSNNIASIYKRSVFKE